MLLDQWTRNCDRYRPQPRRVNRNNVFFMREGAPEGRFVLMAMDHTHIFTCGGPLNRELTRISLVRDETAFGLFPEFETHLKREDVVAAVEAMVSIPDAVIQSVVQSIPADWEVDSQREP